MSQPQAYERVTDFSERDGDDTDHPALNQEFDAAAQSINQVRANLALIQRDDGALKNGSVTADSLAPSVFDLVLVNVAVAVEQAQEAAISALTSATSTNEVRDQTAVLAAAAHVSQTAAALNAASANAQAEIAATKAKEAAASAASIADGTVISVAGLNGVVESNPLKVALGLNNVSNTTDANKPISIQQQSALNNKADIGRDAYLPTFYGLKLSPDTLSLILETGRDNYNANDFSAFVVSQIITFEMNENNLRVVL